LNNIYNVMYNNNFFANVASSKNKFH